MHMKNIMTEVVNIWTFWLMIKNNRKTIKYGIKLIVYLKKNLIGTSV